MKALMRNPYICTHIHIYLKSYFSSILLVGFFSGADFMHGAYVSNFPWVCFHPHILEIDQ